MNRTQLIKTFKVLIVMTIILILMEGFFIIPGVENFFISWFDGAHGWILYFVVWLLMFLQCNIIQVPAVTILELSLLTGMDLLTWEYILVVMSAYMLGCIVSYFLGSKLGCKAVKWIAGDEDEFEKWSIYINKKGKIWYFLTILLPIFPDDLLCIVAGSLKIDFGFYFFANLIGRTIGLVTMILTLNYANNISTNFPIMLVVWCVGLIVELITLRALKNKEKNYG